MPIRFTSIVDALPVFVPFTGPEARERRTGKPFRARLGANESHPGPSPKALAAMREAAAETWKYGDYQCYELRTAIARFHGVAPDNIVIGEGIDGLMSLITRMLLDPGSPAVMSDGGYPTFAYHAAAQGARLVKVPYTADREDLGALLDAARRECAPLLFISNPNNPMGSWWNAGEIERMIAGLPPHTLLLLDEAYADTAPADAIPPFGELNPQVLRLRTFSKAYGLAGARVGYAVGEPGIISAFDKIRNHFGVTRISQAGALAAIGDQEYLAQSVAWAVRAKARIAAIAAAHGLTPLPSAANFVTIGCGRDGGFAVRLLNALMDRDVFIRKPGVAPQDRCVRVSCGSDADLDIFEAELGPALHEASQ
jgi:histidinol-phosphate aminotransferase